VLHVLRKVLALRLAAFLVSIALVAFGAYHLLSSGHDSQRPRRDACIDRMVASLQKLDQIRTMLREDGLHAVGRFRINDYWLIDGQWTIRGRNLVPEEDVLRSARIDLLRYRSYCHILDDVSAKWARSGSDNGNDNSETEVFVFEGGIAGSSQVISFACPQKPPKLDVGVNDVMDLSPGKEVYVGAAGAWYVKFSR
jgi:hypothetical protein